MKEFVFFYPAVALSTNLACQNDSGLKQRVAVPIRLEHPFIFRSK